MKSMFKKLWGCTIIKIVVMVLVSGMNLEAETIKKYQQYTKQMCLSHNIPHEIAFAIVEVESQWKNVEGWTGDIGIFQLNSRYVDHFEEKFWKRNEQFNPWNEYHNIEIGVAYLKWLYERQGNWEEAIMAYNVGIGTVDKNPNTYWGNKYFVKVVNALTENF